LFQKSLIYAARRHIQWGMLLSTNSSRTFLAEELARRIKNNPRYSQRAFARQMGLSAGELSEVLRGKRNLSLKSALKVARALTLSPAEAKHLVHLTQVDKSQGSPLLNPLTSDTPSYQLTLDMFHVISDWTCFAVLNLADTQGFRFDAFWIAKRLGISRAEAQMALDRLERVGLIERKNGKLIIVKDYVMSPSGIPSEAIRNSHRQILNKAIEALETQDHTERDITGLGMAIDPKQLPSIRKEISDFQDSLVAKYSKGKKSEVYHLEVAFFRLTQRSHERNEE
jgi:uncharacterized protein (TIGR02147 family)